MTRALRGPGRFCNGPPFIAVLLTGLFLGAPASADNDLGRDLVIVRQVVAADYASHPDISDLLARAPVLEISRTSLSRSGWSGVIAKHYSVGQSWYGAVYEQLLGRILKLNDLPDSSTFPDASVLLLPDVPRIAKTQPGPNLLNDVPKLSIDTRLTTVGTSFVSPTTADQIAVFDAGRPAARAVEQYRVMTRAAAREITAKDPTASVMDASLELTLEDEIGLSPTNSQAVLSSADAAIVRAALAGPALQRPVVLVLDDDWPDETTFQSSLDFLVDAITETRRKLRLGAPVFSPGLRTAKFVTPGTANQAGSSHASEIRDALLELQQLEPADGRVQVVYLPFRSKQPCATELLRELITLNLGALSMAGRLGHVDLPAWQVPLQEKQAQVILDSIHPSDDPRMVVTDAAVLQAMFWFTRHYSQASGRPVFVNMSWTTPKFEFDQYTSPPNDTYGVFVTAAGNEGTSLLETPRKYAVDAYEPAVNVITVMNVDGTGKPVCDSTVLGHTHPVLGLAFFGTVRPGVCGTSFSAPRLAWLLAAREATRPSGLSDVKGWQLALNQMVHGLQTSKDDYLGLIPDVAKLFGSN